MADLTIPSTSTANITVNITDEALAVIDITGGVVRFWVAKDLSNKIERAYFVRRSYLASEVLFSDAVNGEVVVYIISENTKNMKNGTYEWALELLRLGASATTAGTIDVEVGSGVLTGTGLDLSAIGDGDLLVPVGTGAANQKTIVVEKEVDCDGVETGNLVTDYTEWGTTETLTSFEIFTANKKFPVCGNFIVGKPSDDT